jgi:DNA-binding CsgD family transcriptional regulator
MLAAIPWPGSGSPGSQSIRPETTSAVASPVAERAQAELLATGARPRRLVRTGIDSLTASERRVAQLAAEGKTNREIAQALFVTQKTIEMHLSHVYRKLEIQARSQLARAMAEQ